MELADAHKSCIRHNAEVTTGQSGSEHTAPPAEPWPQRRVSDGEPSDLLDDSDDDQFFDEHSRYLHPGERHIVRELLEQQKREKELRRRWREMGYKLNNNDDIDDDISGNDNNLQRASRCQQRQGAMCSPRDRVSSSRTA